MSSGAARHVLRLVRRQKRLFVNMNRVERNNLGWNENNDLPHLDSSTYITALEWELGFWYAIVCM